MRRLHPATMIVAFLPRIWSAFRNLLPALFVSTLSGRLDNTGELFAAAVGALGGFGAIAAYLTTRFDIQEGQLVWTSGWIWKRDRRIPLEQVQNVSLKQGLLERAFKVVSLEIETAAGSGAEMKLSVLSEPEADRLRTELMTKAIHVPEAEVDEAPTYRISRDDLLLGAMTENNGMQVLLILLPVTGFASIVSQIEVLAQYVAHLPTGFLFYMGAAATLFIAGLGWIYGAVSYMMKYAHFTVKRDPGAFRVSYGLLTKVQMALREARVEFASLSQTIWQRRLGRATVHAGTAASFGEAGSEAPIGLMVRLSTAEGLIDEVVPGAAVAQLPWQRMPSYFMKIKVFRSFLYLCFWLVAVAVAHRVETYAFLEPILRTRSLVVLGMAVVGMIGSYFHALSIRYALTENVLARQEGIFRRTTSLVPLDRVEVVEWHGPRWWSKRNVSSLGVTCMVHSVYIPMVPREVVDEVLGRVRDLERQRVREKHDLKGTGVGSHMARADESESSQTTPTPD